MSLFLQLVLLEEPLRSGQLGIRYLQKFRFKISWLYLYTEELIWILKSVSSQSQLREAKYPNSFEYKGKASYKHILKFRSFKGCSESNSQLATSGQPVG